ncbi:hypothetical protein [Actinoplanes sp. CA-252034]|uniref:hypothetical protein n=1 Tax=Actinoplanes sp. CA-252034 TaxID=3239906 RepID=UPI003D990DEF
MAVDPLAELSLEEEQVARLVDFYESYASLALGWADVAADSGRHRMEAASALRSAGQWAMLVDPSHALDLLTESGVIWHDLGHGFGTFLLTAFGRRPLDDDELAQQREVLVMALTNSPSDDVPPPLRHPQQQAYLFLALAQMRRRFTPSAAGQLEEVAEGSAHRQGVMPVGSLGSPLHTYWDIGLRLLRNGDDYAPVVGHVASMSGRYAESVVSAKANEHLWTAGAAPVDVSDSDLAAITMAGRRRWGLRFTESVDSVTQRVSGLARVPVTLSRVMDGEVRAGEHDRAARTDDRWPRSSDESKPRRRISPKEDLPRRLDDPRATPGDDDHPRATRGDDDDPRATRGDDDHPRATRGDDDDPRATRWDDDHPRGGR